MKRNVFFVVFIISVMLVVSCGTTPKQVEVTDETFRAVYNKYSSGLILDGATTYTVKSGDTLAHIASAQYGDGFYYPVIMLASKDVVVDPDKIQPGMVLTIPNLERNLADPGARASMKGVINDCAGIEESRDRAATAKGLRDHANTL